MITPRYQIQGKVSKKQTNKHIFHTRQRQAPKTCQKLTKALVLTVTPLVHIDLFISAFYIPHRKIPVI